MEILLNPPITDKLKDLEGKPLFWFLKNKDVECIQHNIEKKEFSFGSVYIETLGSGVGTKLNEDSPMVLPMGEDRVLFAVFDGASSQKEIHSLSSGGISGAFYISHMVSMEFETSQEYTDLSQSPELSAKDIMIAMNKWIFEKMKKVPGVDYSDIPTVPGMAAALLLVDQLSRKLSIAQVADAAIASVNSDGSTAVLTPDLNKKFDAETMTYVAELVGRYGSDLAHIRQIPEAKELIRRQLARSFAKKTNKKGGCGIMNGMREMVSNGLIYASGLQMNEKLSSILLFSDGAILPFSGKDIPVEDAAKALADTLYRKSDTSPLMQGAEILESDPDFIKIPRIKLKDDSTLIEVRFNGK